MTAPKIDTQAPERICTWDIQTYDDAETTSRGWTTSYPPGHPREYILASLSAAREAAAVERAFRDGLAYATNVRVKDHDQAWQQSLARERLGDTAALDALIAERVREAVEAERARIIEALREAWHVGGINLLGDVLEVARGSKEGRDG